MAFMELKPMNNETKKAIKSLTEKITADISADDALKFTQAALNLAHTEATIKASENLKK